MKSKTRKALAYLVARLQEGSTIRAIIILLSGALGVALTPDKIESAITVGVTLAAVVGAVLPDTVKKPKQDSTQ